MSSIPQIIVGDLNTYRDFEWPMKFLTNSLPKLQSSTLVVHNDISDMTIQDNRKQVRKLCVFHNFLHVRVEESITVAVFLSHLSHERHLLVHELLVSSHCLSALAFFAVLV